MLNQKLKAQRLDERHFNAALKESNRSKNRYSSVPALESTRVKLQGKNHFQQQQTQRQPQDMDCCVNENDDDYVNANFVSSCFNKKHFIACQAPLPLTFNDFWQMIYEEDVAIILMPTCIEEDGNVKADEYWPEFGSRLFGNFVVTYHGSQSFQKNNLTLRFLSLQLEATGERRRVFHLQYTGWPDHGVPNSPLEILSVMNLIGRIQARWQCGSNPIVVHCSAGVGRTGTFIAIWNCIAELRQKGNCQVGCVVEKLRSERFRAVTTPEQYVFIYHTVQYFLEETLKRAAVKTK